MSSFASWIGIVALVAVVAGWVSYLSAIPRGKVAVKPTGTLVVELGGAALAVAALVWSQRAGSALSASLVVPSAGAVGLGLFWVYLYGQRKVPKGDIQVRVGAPMLAFEATDSFGKRFSSESLRGKRTLLKFFRGSW